MVTLDLDFPSQGNESRMQPDMTGGHFVKIDQMVEISWHLCQRSFDSIDI